MSRPSWGASELADMTEADRIGLSVALTPLLGGVKDVIKALMSMLEVVADWMTAHPEMVKMIGMAVGALFALKVGLLGVRMIATSVTGAYYLLNGVLAGSIWVFGGALKAVAVMVRAFAALRVVLPMVTRATGENASFGTVGSQRGWGGSHPGRLIETILQSRIANPVMVVDEIEKAGTVVLMNGHAFGLTV